MDSNDITDTMIAELYKLNYINKMKMRFISKTIKAFGSINNNIGYYISVCRYS